MISHLTCYWVYGGVGVRKLSLALQKGVSTVELLVAMTVLSTVAIGVFGLLSNTESTLLKSRSNLTNQQSEEALGAYLYEEFITYDETVPGSGLTDFKEQVTFSRADFPNTTLRYRSLMGYQTRYADASPTAKCRLTSATNEIIGTVSFRSDCVTIPEGAADNQTIAQVMNQLLKNDVPISFGVENVGSLCTVTQAMNDNNTSHGKIATLTVDDPNCLDSASVNPGQPAKDAEIIFPRFVVYSSTDVNRYNTSLIDRPTGKTIGIDLTGPESMVAQSGVSTPETGLILTSLSDDQTGIAILSSPLIGAELTVSDSHGAAVAGDNTRTLTLTGTFGQLKEAIRELFYKSPTGFFGSDSVSVVVRSGAQRSVHQFDVDISPNCGDQVQGTATRFDLGYIDNSTGIAVFDETTATFLTTVSVFNPSSPTHFYGYCQPNSHRYDFVQQKRINGSMCNPTSTHDNTTYQRYSSRLMTYDNGTAWNLNSSINVFLYEESDNMTQDRYALQLILDGYPGICNSGTAPTTLAASRSSGNAMKNSDFKDLNLPDDIWPNSSIKNDSDRRCRLAFRLSNIEPGRDLDDTSDLHTFTDDPDEYTGVIGTDGRLTARASWQVPIDGVVVPLRVTNTSTTPVELRNYTFGNPIFELLFWDTLNSWNIRALDPVTNKVVFRRIPFAPGNANQTQAIRLNINQSRRCGT